MKHCHMSVGAHFFEEMARKRRESPGEVVMVIQRPNGCLLLTTKVFYPKGVYRLPTGQIEVGEQPEEALVREVREETGFDVAIERPVDVIHFTFSHASRQIDYLSYIYLTTETVGEPSPEDDGESITGFRDVDACILRSVAQQLENLPDRWADWGRFRAAAHEIVYRELCIRTP